MKVNSVSTIQIVRQGEYGEPIKQEFIEKTSPLGSDPSILFVASKKGVYYYPIKCSKAQALSVKNMLYFKDKTAAEGAGYRPHSECF